MSEPQADSGGSVLGAAAGGVLAGGAFGLVFGLLAELPWEDVKTDAGAFANRGRGVRRGARHMGAPARGRNVRLEP